MRVKARESDVTALRASAERVKQAQAALVKSVQLWAEVQRRAEATEGEIIRGLAGLDPLDDGALDEHARKTTRLATIRDWLGNGWHLRRAVEAVEFSLRDVEPLMKAVAQPRCVEENQFYECHWLHELNVFIPEKEIHQRVRDVDNMANEVLVGIGAVLSARRGALINVDERASRTFKYPDQTVRQLSIEELVAGFAYE